MALDAGVGIYTGGLGGITSPGYYVGLVLSHDVGSYFVIEGAIHYSNQLETLAPNATQRMDMDVQLIPITLGTRYHFLGVHAPISPYIAAGVGVYGHIETLIDQTYFPVMGGSSTTTTALGAYWGGGVAVLLGSDVSLGLDIRYHWISFPDANQTFNGTIPAGSLSGSYLTPLLSLTFGL